MNLKAIDLYLKERLKGKSPTTIVEDADMADYLVIVLRRAENVIFVVSTPLSYVTHLQQ